MPAIDDNKLVSANFISTPLMDVLKLVPVFNSNSSFTFF